MNAALVALEEPEGVTIRVPVLRVFDGDGFLTRIVNARRDLVFEVAVRFGFIDAPELEQPGGYEARDFLSWLVSGQLLDLAILTKMDTGRIVDRHGRIVAIPYLRGSHPSRRARNIELEMVLNGWAWILDRYGPSEEYFAALEDAQRHRRGIWARPDNIHPWEFKRRKYRQRQGCRQEHRQGRLSFDAPPLAACPMPGCRGHIVSRTGRFGPFHGCSAFPDCRFSRSGVPR